MRIKYIGVLVGALLAGSLITIADVTSFVDPRIGTEGLGRVFPGPCAPFGMVRPGPDCSSGPNSGWLPMPAAVSGFSQIHVSGTGGGQKYGNILIQPFVEENKDFSPASLSQKRVKEEIELGRYFTEYENGILTEITTAERAAIYHFTYPIDKGNPGIMIDCGWFLGLSDVPDGREAQMLVGSQVEIVNDSTIRGYSRVRGGWNNGRAYTVYFCAQTSEPFTSIETFRTESTLRGRENVTLSRSLTQADHGDAVGAFVEFDENTSAVTLRIGLSYISELKAADNLGQLTGKKFAEVHSELLSKWGNLLGRIELDADTPERDKRMFYSALYRTMLMPSDRTGENPLWTDKNVPYYDDFYAIWDTYRTSSPLLLIVAPEREREIVNSLINIWKREGYMPDARSGNANGRTQGGSNAEIVVADAFVKGLDGVEYSQALQAMISDAEADPGKHHEAEGRGGLREYNTLGYIPYGIARAGNRTVEYSLCDFAIAQVAKGLGEDSIASKYEKRSHNWRNLWRGEYLHDGAKGFIMPKDEKGCWLDSLPFGHADKRPKFRYTPVMFEGPWYTPWWDMFFYEASAWVYSLSMPHDVEALIDSCGGPKAFEQRLDTFFDRPYFNVNNEPSFLSPCLYQWVGRPDKTADRIRQIIAANYSDSSNGLPGNDDSGAMSSWLVFNMLGLYPNAAHDYYILHSPLIKSATIHLTNGRDFTITAPELSEKNPYVLSATLNGQPCSTTRLLHDDLMRGGTLRIAMGGKDSQNESPTKIPSENQAVGIEMPYTFTYKLHGQTRRFKLGFEQELSGAVVLHWSIVRNLKLWTGTYRMLPQALEKATELSWLMPEDGLQATLPSNELFALVSRQTLQQLKVRGEANIDGQHYKLLDKTNDQLHIQAQNKDHTEMWIADNPSLPLILKMTGNPHEINWEVGR